MDEWKRKYSNNDTKTVALPWFWENYDPAGYSLWRADYKHNAELVKLFMTCNSVNGWIQRLEKLHKYAFAAILIFGKEPEPMSISCVWMFRGLDVPKEMVDCDDYELYTWKKLDHADAAHRKMIDEFFAWEGDFEARGKPSEGKTFK